MQPIHVRTTVFILLLVLSHITMARGNAYVMVGNVDAITPSAKNLNLFGVDSYQGISDIVKDQYRMLQQRGYRTQFIAHAEAYDLKKVLMDPETRAIAWFSHGEAPGEALRDSQNRTISSYDIRAWAQEFMEDMLGHKITRDSVTDEMWNDYSASSPHFYLEYAYIHTPSSLVSHKLKYALMNSTGDYYGYEGTAGNWYEPVSAKNSILKTDRQRQASNRNSSSSANKQYIVAEIDIHPRRNRAEKNRKAIVLVKVADLGRKIKLERFHQDLCIGARTDMAIPYKIAGPFTYRQEAVQAIHRRLTNVRLVGLGCHPYMATYQGMSVLLSNDLVD